MLRQQEQNQSKTNQIPAITSEVETNNVASSNEGPKIKVSAFHFVGDVKHLREKILQRVLKSYLGKELNFPQLQQAAFDLTSYLHNHGYAFARAYITAQEVKDGIIEVTIVIGQIEDIRIQGHHRLKDTRILKILNGASLNRSSDLNMGNLERGLLLLNDMPGIDAHGNLEPGKEQGTSVLDVDVSQNKLISGSVSTDNFGNRYTGSQEYNTQLSLNDPFGLGDQLNLTSTSSEDMQIYKTAYNAPIGYSGLRAGLDYTNLYYKIGKELSNLDAKGTAQIAGANLSYPLIRQRDTNLQATVGWDYKAMRDQSNGIVVDNKRVEVWNLGVSGNSRDGFLTGGLNYYSVAILLGRLNLSRVPNSIILDQATAKTNGSYNKFTYNFVRLQRLINNFSFFTAVNGQFAGKDLDSSEKFLLGGPTGVRAYPTGEASGDDGWVTNVELRYDVPLITKLGVLQLVGFYDIGGIARYRNTWDGWNSGIPNEPNHYTLSGAGLGVNLLKGTNYAVRVSYAWTIGDNPGRSLSGANSDGKHKTGMLWVQLIINF